ncbi:transient receptor potential cation channel protein painless-like [Calliphora vicina]|uniref:transient receptor potential cation channel protein painless-like n=1 Tax=Calliphora vicina TaxID=7373 RepID=UPI00325A9387
MIFIGREQQNMIELLEAFANHNIWGFMDALRAGANALEYDDENLCIFEKVLAKPRCLAFVQKCVRSGCDPNHLNKFFNKRAIHFAVDSQDPGNLKELLSSGFILVNEKYFNLTPLNCLCKNLNNENYINVTKCIKILLRYRASPNIADQGNVTPLQYVKQNQQLNDVQKNEIIQIFESLTNVGMLEEKYFAMKSVDQNADHLEIFNSLKDFLSYGFIERFVEMYIAYIGILSNIEKLQLLVVSIMDGAHRAFDFILASDLDYNGITNYFYTPIQITWTNGNWYCLEKLLQQPLIEIQHYDHPLIDTIHRLNNDNMNEYSSYWKCFDILLESEQVDINETVMGKFTALHYAVKNHNNKAVKQLLKRGACISLGKNYHEVPLNGMRASVLEEHLDDCISSTNHEFDDKNYEIIIDYKNFVTSNEESVKQMDNFLLPIQFLAKSIEHQYLLHHPVISTLFYLKWCRVSILFLFNCMLYITFTTAMFTHIIMKFCDIDNVFLKELALGYSKICLVVLIVRECIQFITYPRMYLKTISNYLEIFLIILSMQTLDYFNQDMDLMLQRNMAVACILVLACGLFLLVGSFPFSFISTHLLMLKAVFKTFVMSFLLYSFFIFSFTLCFYIQYANKPPITKEKYEDEQEEEEEEKKDDFNSFSIPLVAFTKTIVMFTGEFDASSLNLDSFYKYWLFLSFVLFAIILFNLLNGLAVSDTQVIRDQAEFNDILCRIDALSRSGIYNFQFKWYNKAFSFFTNYFSTDFTKRCKVSKWFNKTFSLFTNYFLPDFTIRGKVSIFPNKGNKVFYPKVKTKLYAPTIKVIGNDKDTIVPLTDSYEYVNDHDHVFCRDKVQQVIDKSTVTKAMSILEKKSTKSKECRIDVLEEKLNTIIGMLSNKT